MWGGASGWRWGGELWSLSEKVLGPNPRWPRPHVLQVLQLPPTDKLVLKQSDGDRMPPRGPWEGRAVDGWWTAASQMQQH